MKNPMTPAGIEPATFRFVAVLPPLLLSIGTMESFILRSPWRWRYNRQNMKLMYDFQFLLRLCAGVYKWLRKQCVEWTVLNFSVWKPVIIRPLNCHTTPPYYRSSYCGASKFKSAVGTLPWNTSDVDYKISLTVQGYMTSHSDGLLQATI